MPHHKLKFVLTNVPTTFGYEAHGHQIGAKWLYRVHTDGDFNDLPPGSWVIPSLHAPASKLPPAAVTWLAGRGITPLSTDKIYDILVQLFPNIDDHLPL